MMKKVYVVLNIIALIGVTVFIPSSSAGFWMTVMALMGFVSLVFLVLGLIKPQIMRQETRKGVVIKGASAFLIFMILSAIANPEELNNTTNIVENTPIHKEKNSDQVPKIEVKNPEITIDRQASTTNSTVEQIKSPKTLNEVVKKVAIDIEKTTLNKKIDVSLTATVQNDNGKVTIQGTTNLPNNTQLSAYVSNDFINYSERYSFQVVNGEFTLTVLEDKGKPLFNGEYDVSISIKSLNTQPKNVQYLIGEGGKNLSGDLVKNRFNKNNIRYTTSFNIKNSTDKQEIVSVANTNIKRVIKSLKENYNIEATDFNNEKLNKFKMCWNERSCQIYADTVQIQAIHHSVEALTSSMVTPQYYQKVCSAIFIALTGANKQLVEQQISVFFNHASKKGRARWEALGVEITISPDSSGILGCSFYKDAR